MRHKLRVIIEQLYFGMLSLYPSRFRANFGDELQDIFLRVVDEAEGAENRELFILYFHELKSLVISIIRERWHELKSGKEMTPENNGVFQNGRASLAIVKSPNWLWIVRWTLVMTAAILVGWLLNPPFTVLLLFLYNVGTKIGIVPGLSGEILEFVGIFAGIALSYATFQWLMLRKYLPRPNFWFLSTGIGLLAAGILIRIAVSILNNLTVIPFWSMVVFFMILGTFVGLAQWLVLRKIIRNAVWILVIDVLAAGSFLLSGRSITSLIELLIILILPGLITGVGIWILLKHSQPVDEDEEREIGPVRTKKRTKKWLWILAVSISLIPLFFAYCWLHAVSHIALAKNEGIYATVEEAVIALNSQGWGGAQVVKIEDVHASPNSWDGSQPHVWFGGGMVYLDRVPKGWDRTQYLAGSFYIHVREGWVHVPEGAFPEFIGWIMELYDLEGVNEWIQENG
jgi:hypothetical protein